MIAEYSYRVVTAEDQSTLREENPRMSAVAWPEFMRHDPVQLGGGIIKVCPRAMRITGSVPGALVPVEIDREADQGVYIEPNVWTVHAAK